MRHFLACVSQPAVGAETTVEIDIAGEQFHANGRAIIAVQSLFILLTFEFSLSTIFQINLQVIMFSFFLFYSSISL